MLELYQAEECPHSTEVRETLSELGISYVIHNPRSVEDDVRNGSTYQQLVDGGGEDQIPYLVDTEHGETLYESDAIIEHLEEHYG